MCAKSDTGKLAAILVGLVVAGAFLAPAAAACEDPDNVSAVLWPRPPEAPARGTVVLKVDPRSARDLDGTLNRMLRVEAVIAGSFDAGRVEVNIPIWTSCSVWSFGGDDAYLVGEIERLPNGRNVLSPTWISWRDRRH